MKNGIDVSSHQGEIDWNQVKDQIDFAIIRCGYGSDIAEQDDRYFVRNASECTRLGIPFGVYLYSYATNVEQAKSEADHVLRLVENYKLEYPIYFDIEDPSQATLSNEVLADICVAFCEKIEDAGYYVGIYSNLNWLNTKLNLPELDEYDKWVAQWNQTNNYRKTYGMWQYSNQGTIKGIEGRVDLNRAYYDFPLLLKNQGPNDLDDGKEETIPPATNQTYTVQKGDSLSKIAKQYQVTVNNLVKWNEIENRNLIYPGQVLKIYQDTKTYTVVKGDNLSNIAKKYGMSWQELYEKNKDVIGDNPSLIYAGQILTI